MKQNVNHDQKHRIVSMILAIVMLLSMMPVNVFAASACVLTTDIGEKEFVVGTATEFSLTTVANDDVGTMVKGYFDFSDPAAVEKLEFKDKADGNWYEISGEYGPEDGFPVEDVTNDFRVTFNSVGEYTVTAYYVTAEFEETICSVSETVAVKGRSTVSTDIANKTFVVNEATEFSYTTMANEDTDVLVKTSFAFSDEGAVKKLEYKDTAEDKWVELKGDFGPENGFILADNDTDNFRVTFSKAGTYKVTIKVKNAETGALLCDVKADVIVKERVGLSFVNNKVELKYTDKNVSNAIKDTVSGAEYTYNSDNQGVVRVDENGILHPVSTGTTVITVTRKESTGYMSASASYVVTVTKGEQTALTWDKTVPESIAWNAEGGYANTVSGGLGDGKVTYSSDNTDCATVDPNTGEVVLKKPGRVKITATKSGGALYENKSAEYVLNIVKADQSALSFAESNPNAIFADDTFENVATGGNSGEAIVYKSLNTRVATVDANGKVTAVSSGNVTITAYRPADEYYNQSETIEYSLTVNRKSQNNVYFLKGTENQKITYGQAEVYINDIQNSATSVMYKSSDTSVATVNAQTGEVTAKKAGTVTITATSNGNGKYDRFEKSYELTVERAQQVLTFAVDKNQIAAVTYGDRFENPATAKSEITYVSSDTDVAEVDENGRLTIKKAGTVTITATAETNDWYFETSDSYTLTINKAEQSISFAKGLTPSVIFNDNGNKFSNTASSSAIDKDIPVEYSVVSGNEFVVENSFDSSTGEFEIKGAGTISISVKFSENDRYLENTETYTLIVSKDDQIIGFDNEEYDMANGDNTFVFPAAKEKSEFYGTGEFKYYIVENEDGVASSIDEATGVLDFTNKTGEITIGVTKVADDNYNEASASYKLTVSDVAGENTHYYVSGKKSNDDNEWFISNVSIKAAEGYLISFEKEEGKAIWSDELTDVVTDDEVRTVSFFTREIETGKIFEKTDVEIKKDETAPEVMFEDTEFNAWDKFLYFLINGKHYDETKKYYTFKLSYADATSGMKATKYYVQTGSDVILSEASLDELPETDWDGYRGGVALEDNNVYVIYAKGVDKAGNLTYACSKGVIYDRTKVPEENIGLTILNDKAEFYKDDVTVGVNVSDAMPSSGIKSITYKIYNGDKETQNGELFSFKNDNPRYEDLIPSWESASYDEYIVVDAAKNNSDNVKIVVTVTDNSGNVTEKTLELKIYMGDLDLTVEYDITDPSAEKDGVEYYNGHRRAKITLKGRDSFFKEGKEYPEVAVTATKGNSGEKSTYVIGEWRESHFESSPDESTYVRWVDFYGSAVYELNIDYTDIRGIDHDYHSGAFSVDTDEPEATVTLDNSYVWDDLLKQLTFGLWKTSKVAVEIDASDATSAIKSVEYYYHGNPDKNLTEEELAKVKDWTPYNEFTVSKNEPFVIYAKVKDLVGNTTYISSNGMIIDSDTEDTTITLKAEDANENGVYDGDVSVDIKVEMSETSSGIKSVEYYIISDESETIKKTLYSFDFARAEGSKKGTLTIKEANDDGEYTENVKEDYTPLKEDLRFAFEKTITIDSAANNSGDVRLFVVVTDNAGNVKTKELETLNIDITAPVITVKFDRNDPAAMSGEYGYFDSQRTATVTYTERNFNVEKAQQGIKIEAYDSENKLVDVSPDEMIEWNHDGITHTAKVTFAKDANYKFDVEYTDEAGNTCPKIEYLGGSVSENEFTVDTKAPVASISIGDDYKWAENFFGDFAYIFFKEKPVKVNIEADDETSPFKVYYYKSNAKDMLSEGEVAKVNAGYWKTLTNDYVSVAKDERYTIYFKLVDSAKNTSYFNSQGIILDMVAPEIKLTAEDTSCKHGETPLYNNDVDVKINVTELAKETFSGIKEVKYQVLCNGEETQKGTLYEFKNDAPVIDDLTETFEDKITVIAKDNNSCDVSVVVTVTDNAGNVNEKTLALDIDVTAPTIEVTYDNNDAYKTVDDKGFFPKGRTATVVITERAEHFDPVVATKNIKITAFDGAGNVVITDCSKLISEWSTVASGDESTHTATINYSADANYTFEITYTDLAGNVNDGVDTKDSVAPFKFAVDTVKPEGTVIIENFGEEGKWSTLIEKLTFHLWSDGAVYLSSTTVDKTTPVEAVFYYKTSKTEAMKEQELEDLKISDWTPFKGFGVYNDDKFVVYLKIVDSSGNYTYISTDGVVVDTKAPLFDYAKPEITITPELPGGIYNTDVTFAVSVKEADSIEEAYSGINEIRYEVYSMGTKTQGDVLYNFENETPEYSALTREWSKKDALVALKDLNNSNDVRVVVYAVDNAGNESEADCVVKIDGTAPVINVTYDNNNGDSSFRDSVYFDANRRAKIEIVERNFDPEKVKVEITNTHGDAPKLTDWIVTEGNGNGDNTVHTAYVLYDKDGDYTFDISCIDTADNNNNAVNYNGSLAPEKFTIDKTAPVMNIVYDNNSARNGNYYDAQRTATITIREHNFETSRVRASLAATDNGTAIAAPSIGTWTTNGDVHTARVTFSADARYVFDFDYTDKAGNKTADIPQQTFFVDKTNPVLSIQNIVDKSANNDEGNIGFVMVATDTNFDVFTPVVTAVVRNGNKIETKELEIGERVSITNGARYVVENIEDDGIYRIACTVVDKAGNAYTQVLLEKEDGTSYVERRAGGNTLVEFSVNRDGSTYDIDEYTTSVVNRYYVQNVMNDVVITEINADPLVSYEVTLNDKKLTAEGTNPDYTVKESGGNGTWKKYIYTVNKELFADEGQYKLVVSSKDKADNTAFSDIKEASVEFIVDRTAPVVSVSGLADNGRYQTDKQLVTIVPTDDGGALSTLVVNMVDADGNFIREVINLSGDALTDALDKDGGKITFEIPEGLYQNVQIICTDRATGETEVTNISETFVKNVSVSTSLIKIFWANKPLRWGTIGGVGLLAVGLVILIILKKKKNKEA